MYTCECVDVKLHVNFMMKGVHKGEATKAKIPPTRSPTHPSIHSCIHFPVDAFIHSSFHCSIHFVMAIHISIPSSIHTSIPFFNLPTAPML